MAHALTIEDKHRVEEEVIAGIEANPRLGLRQAAKSAGISHTTLYKLMDQSTGFAERVRTARQHAREAAADTLEDALLEHGSAIKDASGVSAATFLLRGLRPEVYSRDSSAPPANHFSGCVILQQLTISPKLSASGNEPVELIPAE